MIDVARNARNSLGITQAEFAKLLGCPRQSIIRWEKGQRSPSRFAQALFALMEDDPERSKRVLKGLRAKRLRKEVELLETE